MLKTQSRTCIFVILILAVLVCCGGSGGSGSSAACRPDVTEPQGWTTSTGADNAFAHNNGTEAGINAGFFYASGDFVPRQLPLPDEC